MRTISSTALEKILTKEGTEPVTLVQIFWSEDEYVIYGDRAFLPEIRGQLLDCGEIENVINASQGSNSGSVAIRLNDTDGSLKTIIDRIDIHKRPVYILQWFDGIPLSDAFIVFDGVISSPLVWKEGERTLSFEVLTKIEDLEIGFSAEEGNFEYIPEGLAGVAWPMCFGTVLHVPAVQVNEIPAGFTNEDTGINAAGNGQGPINDFINADLKNIILLAQLEQECFLMAAISFGEAVSLDPHSDKFNRKSDNPLSQQMYDLGTQYEAKGNEYLQERLRPFNDHVANDPSYAPLEQNQLNITNGSMFPQKQNVIVTINGAQYEGSFDGNIFTIVSKTHPFANQTAVVGPTTVIDRDVATEYRTDLSVQTFFYSVAGSTVTVGNGAYPVYYIIGIPHLTNIVVLAKRDNLGNTKFVVPSSYYTVSYKTFGTLKATFLTMSQPLSTRGAGWQDEIWVNCTSPIGPNAVDIIEYVVENYTNQSVDTTSFTSVKADINTYKCGFALLERMSAFKLIQDIAYQSRCAVWNKGGRFYLKYLAKKHDPVDTITETDIESGTLELYTNDTEDVVTRWEVSWRDRMDRNPPRRIIYRYNIFKYGLIEDSYDCYIYNNIASVKKMALFWLLRRSNTWKKIRFSTFLTKICLEPFDTVLIDFATGYISDEDCTEPVLGIIEKAAFDSESQRIVMEIWLPIRLGEMCPYLFAYPRDLSVTDIFPQDNDPGIITDIPGNQATGPLFDQVPLVGAAGQLNSTPSNSGFGGGSSLSDANDTANPEVFDPPVELSPGDLQNSGEPEPIQEVSQRIIKPIDLSGTPILDGAFPAIVLEQGSEENTYSCHVYLSGPTEPPVIMNVKQMQLDPEDIIPGGTAVIVLRNCKRNSNGFVNRVEYTMQVPIWLEPADESTVVPPAVPTPDEGSTPPPEDEPPEETDTGDQ